VADTRLDFIALLSATVIAAGVIVSAGGGASAWATCRALPFAALVSLPFAIAAVAARIVSPSGAAAGLLVSSLLLAGAGWPAWSQLGVVLIVAAAATRAGRARKSRDGLLDDPHGRGWRNVAANTGLAACAALGARHPTARDLSTLVIAAVLIAGAGDTVASEVGKGFGRPSAVSLIRTRRVPAGTPGAISLVGTMAGIGAVAAMAICADLLRLIASRDVASVATAAMLAVVADSAIAELLESRGWLDNDGVNLLATWTAALAAIGLHALRA
jgi:uncharacterized protein (TIGR00297 family)